MAVAKGISTQRLTPMDGSVGDDHVASGERVTVLAVEGVILTVERLEVAPKSEDNPSSPP